jgi:hypothetical protein
METTDDAYVGGNVTTISPHVAGFVSKLLAPPLPVIFLSRAHTCACDSKKIHQLGPDFP